MTPRAVSPPRLLALLGRRPPFSRNHVGGPTGERAWARMMRWFADRRTLAEMDDRLLADIGLTRADLARGAPFQSRRTKRGQSADGRPHRPLCLIARPAR